MQLFKDIPDGVTVSQNGDIVSIVVAKGINATLAAPAGEHLPLHITMLEDAVLKLVQNIKSDNDATISSEKNITLKRNAECTAVSIFQKNGGKVSNTAIVKELEDGATVSFYDLNLLSQTAEVESKFVISHAHKNTSSLTLCKGVYRDNAKASFIGEIMVTEGAIGTKASQLNKSLLLSEDAVVETSPILKVFCDDVDCQHGATVGQLDEEALFYLMTRGIEKAVAKEIMVEAFCAEIISRSGF